MMTTKAAAVVAAAASIQTIIRVHCMCTELCDNVHKQIQTTDRTNGAKTKRT